MWGLNGVLCRYVARRTRSALFVGVLLERPPRGYVIVIEGFESCHSPQHRAALRAQLNRLTSRSRRFAGVGLAAYSGPRGCEWT